MGPVLRRAASGMKKREHIWFQCGFSAVSRCFESVSVQGCARSHSKANFMILRWAQACGADVCQRRRASAGAVARCVPGGEGTSAPVGPGPCLVSRAFGQSRFQTWRGRASVHSGFRPGFRPGFKPGFSTLVSYPVSVPVSARLKPKAGFSTLKKFNAICVLQGIHSF